jgi:hypothetical protein
MVTAVDKDKQAFLLEVNLIFMTDNGDRERDESECRSGACLRELNIFLEAQHKEE